ncbi:MAG TPA: sugar ABC transporter permease, partial [Dehalococcoidia bacterium]|nr:sugar ABC transporter permease [Dehalococcoidia bacterium]
MAAVDELPVAVIVVVEGPRVRLRSQLPTALLLLLPALVVLGIFHFFPLLYALYISLHRWRFVDQGFVGLQNYQAALTSDAVWSSLANTAFFVMMVVPTTMGLALVLSVMLFQRVRFLAVYRTIYFLPYVTSSVAAAGVWAWIFNPQYGIANQLLHRVGAGSQGWLQDPEGLFLRLGSRFGIVLPEWAHGPSMALVAIAIMTIWSFLGFEIVIFLVGLGNIPREIYEAARVDGAGPWQLLRRISLPLLSPSVLLISIITTIGSFQEFNRIYQMSTQANVGTRPGGPLGSTQTLVLLVYNEFYSSLHVGYGAAIAFILFA